MVFSAFFNKPFNTSSQKGQAVTEYLLVMILVVGIALGAIYQLSGAFKKYVESYFGDYVACILETGELPNLGGSSGANAEGCESEYEPFTMKNGRPLMAGKGGGGGGGNKIAMNSSSPRINGKNSGSINSERGNGGSTVATGKKSSSIGKTSSGSGDADSTITLRGRQQALDGKFRIAGDPEAQKEGDKAAAQQVIGSGGKGRSPRKLAFDPAKKSERDKTVDSEMDFSIGSMLRYILIAGIIIAIVMVVGSQLMQVRRNQNAQ